MPEIDGNKKVTLEELKLVHDIKLDKDFSGLTALPQSPANGDTLVVQSNNTNYKIDYSALASAIISQLGTSGVVSIAHGGTGSTTAANALTALGAVSGVKGNSESTYRNGNVNITAANIGALTSSDIVNDLTSSATDKPLSANMGKALNDAIAQSTAKAVINNYFNIPISVSIDIGFEPANSRGAQILLYNANAGAAYLIKYENDMAYTKITSSSPALTLSRSDSVLTIDFATKLWGVTTMIITNARTYQQAC